MASANPEILGSHRKFLENRKTWYIATSAGLAMWLVGAVQTVNSVFDSSAGGGAGALLLMGVAGIIGGQVARIVGFRSLRKAVNLYNHQYAGKVPAVSLNLGLPSTSPAGLGLYVKF
ncbi:hypothetical protein [Persicitalea jodogahamensis]|uniref:hypothetical protein n=1 Tax=Persicitalea jodogahamensis TaxID=402147 RepID=UPI00167B5013|nr:hypothetical protein [Persicitalea jodogahamensis]